MQVNDKQRVDWTCPSRGNRGEGEQLWLKFSYRGCTRAFAIKKREEESVNCYVNHSAELVCSVQPTFKRSQPSVPSVGQMVLRSFGTHFGKFGLKSGNSDIPGH